MSHDLHFESIDWSSDIHQRIIAASLVEGAYNIELKRHENNKHAMENAMSIGERLGFEVSNLLIDTKDGSYFAIIYKFKHDQVPNYSKSSIPPKYVIAFRGTCCHPETLIKDFKYDFEFIFSELHKSSRYTTALQVMEDIISISGGVEHVWLAGHSLGSLMAIMVGRSLVIEKGVHMKTFLFNPPFVGYGNLKSLCPLFWYTRSILTAGVEMLVHHDWKSTEANKEVFDKLKSWMPKLFVNKRDYISNGYICYFKQRKKMNKIGLGLIENIATQNSLVSLVGELVGGHCEPVHLIPSANLTITKSSRFHPLDAHKLSQWWQNGRSLKIKTKPYCF